MHSGNEVRILKLAWKVISNALCLLHIIWLANELKNSQGIHRYPCEFSYDIVTSWRQHFRAINTDVFNVQNLDTCP